MAAALQAVAAHLGKIQRLSAVELLDALPRSEIGKVMKRELRDAYRARARGQMPGDPHGTGVSGT